MSPRLPRLWLVGSLLLLGCANPPDISDEIETYAGLLTDARSSMCDCPQLLGYADSAQCDEGLGRIGTGERQCFAMVLDGHEDAAKEHLTCVNAAYQLYTHCLETNMSCEADIYTECTDEHEGRIAACPAMPSGVQSEFEACAG